MTQLIEIVRSGGDCNWHERYNVDIDPPQHGNVDYLLSGRQRWAKHVYKVQSHKQAYIFIVVRKSMYMWCSSFFHIEICSCGSSFYFVVD